MSIENWIIQMETFFMAARSPPSSFVGEMLQRIHPKHFDEVRPHIGLKYFEFREKLFEIFEEPDLIFTWLQQLNRIHQDREETVSTYMDRVRRLVLKAYRKSSPEEQERMLVGHFTTGLADPTLREHLFTASPKSASDALKMATASEANRTDP